MHDVDLKRRLTLFGVPNKETSGWATRGSSNYTPKMGINHHTAGAKYGNTPSMNVVINGRTGLPGPLCQVLQSRDDVAWLIAAGKANHGGVGDWRGVSGNTYAFGLEIEYSGTTAEAFSAHRFDTAARIQAAAAYGKYEAGMVAQHFQYAKPLGRKIDLLRAALDANGGVDAFVKRIAFYLDNPPGLAPVIVKPKPIPKLDRVLGPGMVDKPDNPIIAHVENLLLWNAVKSGRPNQNPGKVGDGKYTTATAQSVTQFRRWFYDLQVVAGVPENKRVFKSREGEGFVGPTMLRALEYAAAA